MPEDQILAQVQAVVAATDAAYAAVARQQRIDRIVTSTISGFGYIVCASTSPPSDRHTPQIDRLTLIAGQLLRALLEQEL